MTCQTVAYIIKGKTPEEEINKLELAETNEEASVGNHGSFEMEKLPLGRPKHMKLSCMSS